MEIKSTTISFSKGKAQAFRKHEAEIKQQLDEMDKNIAIARTLITLTEFLNNMMTLKRNSNVKGKAANFRSKCRWVEEGEKAKKILL